MPAYRTTLGLLIACLGGAMLLWVLNRPAMRGGYPAGRAADTLVATPLREVDHLVIERNGYRAELRRGAEGWMLAQPLQAYASQTAVQRLLDRVERAPLRARIAAHELELRDLTLADFGLLEPQARLVIAGPRLRAELMLGHLTATSNELFACFLHSADVLLTDPGLLDAVPESLFALSDRSFFRGDLRRIGSIGLRRPGLPFLKLAREPGGWMITQPLAARADEAALAALLQALADARIARFVWPEAGSPAEAGDNRRGRLLQFGLDEESERSVQIQLWMAGDPIGRRLRLGTPVADLPGHVHALADDGLAVVAVTNTLVDLVLQPVAALRDKRLFTVAPDEIRALAVQGVDVPLSLRREAAGAWELTSPVAAPAEPGQVSLLLDALLGLRAEAFETARPDAAGTNRLLQVDLAAPSTAFRLVRTGLHGGTDATVGLVLTNETTCYRVATAQWARVEALLDQPEAFRSRTLFRLPAEGIRRITVTQADGARETVEHEGTAAGGWRPSAPDRKVNRVALDGWLHLLAEVRAERIAALDTGEAPETYGLAAPHVEVTIDLADTDRLRRILIVGGKTPEGGRFAAIKGHDTIYVLGVDTCRQLEQSFLLPVERRVPSVDTTRPPQPEAL